MGQLCSSADEFGGVQPGTRSTGSAQANEHANTDGSKEAFLMQEHGGAGLVIVNKPITADAEFEWVCDLHSCRKVTVSPQAFLPSRSPYQEHYSHRVGLGVLSAPTGEQHASGKASWVVCMSDGYEQDGISLPVDDAPADPPASDTISSQSAGFGLKLWKGVFDAGECKEGRPAEQQGPDLHKQYKLCKARVRVACHSSWQATVTYSVEGHSEQVQWARVPLPLYFCAHMDNSRIGRENDMQSSQWSMRSEPNQSDLTIHPNNW